MRIRLTTVTLGLAVLCVAAPAWAKSKKKKKPQPTSEDAPSPEGSRLLIFDAEHPTAPPTVLVVGEGEPKVPDAPLLTLTSDDGLRATSPAVDKTPEKEPKISNKTQD